MNDRQLEKNILRIKRPHIINIPLFDLPLVFISGLLMIANRLAAKPSKRLLGPFDDWRFHGQFYLINSAKQSTLIIYHLEKGFDNEL